MAGAVPPSTIGGVHRFRGHGDWRCAAGRRSSAGAASGIGRAHHRAVRARGAAVLAVDRDEMGLSRLRDVSAQARGSPPRRARRSGSSPTAPRRSSACRTCSRWPDRGSWPRPLPPPRPRTRTSTRSCGPTSARRSALSRAAVIAFGEAGGAIVNTSSAFALTGVARVGAVLGGQGAGLRPRPSMAADYGRARHPRTRWRLASSRPRPPPRRSRRDLRRPGDQVAPAGQGRAA